MFTPPKIAPIIAGALALALAGAAPADNPAARTAKKGWSTEPSCQEQNFYRRVCWTLTRGMAVLNPSHSGATLKYSCDTQLGEWLLIAFYSAESPRKNASPLRVRWGRQSRGTVDIRVGKWRERGRSVYEYHIEDTGDFIEKMKEHKTLNVFLPFSPRPYEVRFRLANAIPSIRSTMKGCNLQSSTLGDVHQ